MSFLFISHANVDKQRIRPLVEVLVEEGETLWLDRPGAGDGNFGFDQSYIDANGIDHLQSGNPWSSSIKGALRASGAVLGCLSRAVLDDRPILDFELMFADVAQKLVTCVVDDLTYEDLENRDRGLLILKHYQSPHLNTMRLAQALRLRAERDLDIENLPEQLRSEWEKVRNLLSDVDRIRPEPGPLRPKYLRAAATRLERIPVGPPFHVSDVPREIIGALGDALNTAERIESALAQATALVAAAFPDGYTERQIFLRRGQLPPFGSLPSDTFWTQVLCVAGLKSRRTLASFLMTPWGRWAVQRAGVAHIAESFLSQLETTVL